MYDIYNDYEVYIGYIQLSEEVLQKYHPRVADPKVIAVYILYTPNNHYICDIYYDYIFQQLIYSPVFNPYHAKYAYMHSEILAFFWKKKFPFVGIRSPIHRLID